MGLALFTPTPFIRKGSSAYRYLGSRTLYRACAFVTSCRSTLLNQSAKNHEDGGSCPTRKILVNNVAKKW